MLKLSGMCILTRILTYIMVHPELPDEATAMKAALEEDCLYNFLP